MAKRPDDVSAMFDEVAPRYDFMNTLASLGRDRRWRRDTVAALAPRAGERVLDLAAGTGSSAAPLARRGAVVVAVDRSHGMALVGHRRHQQLHFVLGDAQRLPFADGAFDAATVSFGLRNVADPLGALVELRRVVRPDGTLVICEFSTPVWPLFRRLYRLWNRHVMPRLARVGSSDPAAYSYLAESIADWPDQRDLATLIRQAGWAEVEWRNLTGGVVALHRARRP
ncbi:MAG: class I SAM-dependent methyltransferase [Propionibacteriaceae bacterium]|jgi:demethylmenaquinone methyltransferase/2-methoxy-6-polyprenyl-1,4-benzoquinol methylase|nr:class I SAM-dependent methyltransferase [Propionibacteriaceae bacterium]